MRALVLLAALSVTAPNPAEELEANKHWCEGANTHPDRRIAACSWLIRSGKLMRSKFADVFYYRGNAYGAKGKQDLAIGDYSEAVRLFPKHANAFHDRGKAHENKGAFDLAIRDYGAAIRLEPDFALALNSKAWLLATAPDAALRNGEEAIGLALRALQLVAYPSHHGTLAAAYAEAGRFADAERVQTLAIDRLRATGRVVSISEYEDRLELYRARRPYRR
jgi:tetratricopeptide (TPR) repeat protein